MRVVLRDKVLSSFALAHIAAMTLALLVSLNIAINVFSPLSYQSLDG